VKEEVESEGSGNRGLLFGVYMCRKDMIDSVHTPRNLIITKLHTCTHMSARTHTHKHTHTHTHTVLCRCTDMPDNCAHSSGKLMSQPRGNQFCPILYIHTYIHVVMMSLCALYFVGTVVSLVVCYIRVHPYSICTVIYAISVPPAHCKYSDIRYIRIL
jgi:hypothetical protein